MPMPPALTALGLALGVLLAPVTAAPLWAETTAPLAAPPPAAPVDAARLARLGDLLMMDEIFAVMRDEGIEYSRTLSDEMFGGKGGADWDAVVALIYEPQAMRQRFDDSLTAALSGSPAELAEIEAFFGSERGRNILRLELEARRALLEDEVEEAAKLAWEDMQAANDPRVAPLTRFAEINDLVESNVMGAMNANLAFYRGLAEAGAFPEEMTEDQMLADVWGQEPDVRAETEAWLYPYLSLAYQPLSAEDLDAYIAFSDSAAGRAMNAALFSAFDAVFTRISLDLGRAAARQMQGEDI